jgi:hypothetical protein
VVEDGMVDLPLGVGASVPRTGLYLTMKSEWAPCMICFSERMCSCCLVSTMWRFLRIFIANVLDSSLFNWTLKISRKDKWGKAYRFDTTQCTVIQKFKDTGITSMNLNYHQVLARELSLKLMSHSHHPNVSYRIR